ncbi:MAG TPA: NADH-quinone oxidoreductase subunit C [Candidatus Eremiobacteraceae bacterium]|nr:NADH-quinone oxidoreductase subunit C [Candidatus Eremiobacteraceae bacterium]
MSETLHAHPERAALAGVLERLRDALGEGLLEAVSAEDMDEAAIIPSGLHAAVNVLRAAGFNMLADIGATDHLPLSPRFEVSYHFAAIDEKSKLVLDPARYRLRVFPDDSDPVVPTLCGVWPAAEWPEREVYDLFGIRFDAHPNLKRILMPDDWRGFPLRKDYPLRGNDRNFVPGGRLGPIPPVNPA